MSDEQDKIALDTALWTAARNNKTADVKALLEKGADADFLIKVGATPALGWAAFHGDLEMVTLLLEAGANKEIRDEQDKTATVWANDRGYFSLAKLIEEFQPSPPKTPDEVIFESPVSDRVMEEVFNFKTLERITLIRKGKRGAVEAVTRESFSRIEDENTLRNAFNEHVRRGGTADESAVFPNRIIKHTLPRAGA